MKTRFKMKKKVIGVLAAAAFILVAAAGIGGARAYFTTYVEASGVRPVKLGDKTTIEENYASWEKSIRIANDKDSSQPVYVRAAAFAGEKWLLQGAGTGWEKKSDGFYYYKDPVWPGKTTEILKVTILDKATGEKPLESEAGSFDVAIVYETTPAVTNGEDENGNVLFEDANWDWRVSESAEGGEG